MDNHPTQIFLRLSEDGRVNVLMLVILLSGVGIAGLGYRSEQLMIIFVGWLLAVLSLAVLGIIELGAAITELWRHPESFESGDRTADIWVYLTGYRHWTIVFIGIALLAAFILGVFIEVPEPVQYFVAILSGLLVVLGGPYHGLSLAEEEELEKFFEED